MNSNEPNKPTGNTKTVGKNQLYVWCFTLKTNKEEWMSQRSQLSQTFKSICKKFIFSLEQGTETDYLHFQGAFSLKQKEYFNTVKNLIRNDVHLEPCISWVASYKYCSKDDSHIAGPWTEKTVDLKLPKELWDWQKKVIDHVSKPCTDDRSILWLWDDKGCTGKTTLCKILFTEYNADIILNGAGKDMGYALSDNPTIVAINLTRSIEGRVNYGMIEAIKDGMVFCSKYESKMKIFNSPHVLIFANFEPNYETLSEDRYSVFNTKDFC